jgi:SAM-dependent methyltransferase
MGRGGRSLNDALQVYDESYYAGWQPTVARSAGRIVPALIDMVHPASVVDVGCGGGAWAAEFLEHGVSRVIGIDGDYANSSVLAIPRDSFVAADLRGPFHEVLGDVRFDLAVSLEVAEHLPETVAGSFVNSLCALSDTILFSAAVPGQGGREHVNEQWPSYWAAQFRRRGYQAIDVIRPKFWDDAEVAIWYRQNTLLFSRRDDLGHLGKHGDLALDLVHPEYWNRLQRRYTRVSAPPTLRSLVTGLPQACRRSLAARLGTARNR